MPNAAACTVTFPVERGIFGVGRLALALNALANDHRIGNWHPGPWVDWRHQAIAIGKDRILAVGQNSAVDPLIGPRTQVIELGGRTVIPGFNDTHAHMEREGLKRIRLSLSGARSVADIVSRISARARELPPGEWIVTMPIGDPPFFRNVPECLAEKGARQSNCSNA